MVAVSRLLLSGSIRHIQIPWTRVGRSHRGVLLAAGGDDLGGTLLDGRVQARSRHRARPRTAGGRRGRAGGQAVPAVPAAHHRLSGAAGRPQGRDAMSGAAGHVEVAVVGAGSPGSAWRWRCAARAATSSCVLERAASVGGTWRDNTYPGVACDVPSHLYGFADHPNPHWSGVYAPGDEIRCYLERIAEAEHIRPEFDTPVDAATWDDATPELAAGTGRPGRAHAARRRARPGLRPADRAGHPAAARPRVVPRPAVPLGAVGPRRRAGRGADRRRRHRRQRGAAGARTGQARPGHAVPAHPGVDRAARRAGLLRRRASRGSPPTRRACARLRVVAVRRGRGALRLSLGRSGRGIGRSGSRAGPSRGAGRRPRPAVAR